MRKLQPHIANGYFQSFREGKEEGFDYFFKAYYKALCFFANRYLNDLPGAEDIAEESFIKLWEQREKINDEKHLRNWLYKAVYHGCLKWKERHKAQGARHKEIAIVMEREEKDYSENIVRAETMQQLREAMELLPGECKKVFYKLYIEGKTVDETAAELHVTASTVYNQKARGLKLLKIRLGKGFMMLG